MLVTKFVDNQALLCQALTEHQQISQSIQVTDVRFNHTSELVYVSGANGALAILDYPTLEPLHIISDVQVPGHACTSLAVDIRGRYVATGGADSAVNIWDTADWTCQRSVLSAE